MFTSIIFLMLGSMSLVASQNCIVPFKAAGGKCLHVENAGQGGGMTWQDARDYCISLGGTEFESDLASFDTCDTYAEFSRYVAFNYPANITLWMGAHTLFSPDMWQWVSTEALRTGVPFWAYDADFTAGHQCAATSPDNYHRLRPHACDEMLGFACSYTPSNLEAHPTHPPHPDPGPKTDCDGKDDAVLIGGFCFVFGDESLDFSKADAKCRDDHKEWGGELFYPGSCDEFTFMAHHIEASEDKLDYWVGAIDTSGEHEWTWVDGDFIPGGVPYWAAGEPNHTPAEEPRKHCAVMESTERFYLKDELCSTTHHYICKLTQI